MKHCVSAESWAEKNDAGSGFLRGRGRVYLCIHRRGYSIWSPEVYILLIFFFFFLILPFKGSCLWPKIATLTMCRRCCHLCCHWFIEEHSLFTLILIYKKFRWREESLENMTHAEFFWAVSSSRNQANTLMKRPTRRFHILKPQQLNGKLAQAYMLKYSN